MPGRYFSEQDIALINSISDELLGDIIQTEVSILRVCPDQTKINVYGESSPTSGKMYFPAVDIIAIVDRADISTDADDFGPERKQNVAFKFMEKDLEKINLFPQTGDLVLFNDRYHEIDDVVQEQFLGGIPEKSFSIIVNTHYTRLSTTDIITYQS